MLLLFIILLTLSVFILVALILIQNPKGGGLASELGGFNTQFLGVQKTTDVLEKGTWLFSIIILAFCLLSVWVIPYARHAERTDGDLLNNMQLNNPSSADTSLRSRLPVSKVPLPVPVKKPTDQPK